MSPNDLFAIGLALTVSNFLYQLLRSEQADYIKAADRSFFQGAALLVVYLKLFQTGASP